MYIYFNYTIYIQGSGSWSSSRHVKVASGLSAENESLTFFFSFLYLAFPLMLGGQGPVMAYCKKHVIKKLILIQSYIYTQLTKQMML